MKIKIIALSFFCLVTCCQKEVTSIPLVNQVVLFQAEYINNAWTYQHSGWLIDSLGNVRYYNLPKKWNFVDSAGYISATNMSENVQQIDSIRCKIDKDTLCNYFNKLNKAAVGTLTESKSKMFDAGSTRFYGYVFDKNVGLYKQILIKQIGDLYIENKSVEAKQIYEWMERINTRDKNIALPVFGIDNAKR